MLIDQPKPNIYNRTIEKITLRVGERISFECSVLYNAVSNIEKYTWFKVNHKALFF